MCRVFTEHACVKVSLLVAKRAPGSLACLSLSHRRTHTHTQALELCYCVRAWVSHTHTVSAVDLCGFCQWDKVSCADGGSVSIKSLCLLVVPPPADSVGDPVCAAGWVRKRGSSTVSRWETPPSLSSNATSSSVPLAQGLRVLSGENLHFYWPNGDNVTLMKVRLFLFVSRLAFISF